MSEERWRKTRREGKPAGCYGGDSRHQLWSYIIPIATHNTAMKSFGFSLTFILTSRSRLQNYSTTPKLIIFLLLRLASEFTRERERRRKVVCLFFPETRLSVRSECANFDVELRPCVHGKRGSFRLVCSSNEIASSWNYLEAPFLLTCDALTLKGMLGCNQIWRGISA